MDTTYNSEIEPTLTTESKSGFSFAGTTTNGAISQISNQPNPTNPTNTSCFPVPTQFKLGTGFGFGLNSTKTTITNSGCCYNPYINNNNNNNNNNNPTPFNFGNKKPQYFTYNPQTGYTPVICNESTNKKQIIDGLYDELKKIRDQNDALNKSLDNIFNILRYLSDN
jgi:hypothetical protein